MANRLKMILLLVSALFASGFSFRAEEENYEALATRYQPEIASLVQRYLYYYHYQRYRTDDQVSRNLLDSYLKNLDYSRMYFLESDIKSFEKYAYSLDDALTKDPADLRPAFDIFTVFRKRVNERVDYAFSIMEQEYDLSTADTIQLDRSKAAWAKTPEDLDRLWYARMKEEVLRFTLRDQPRDEYLETLRERYTRLRKTFNEFEAPDIVENFLSSLAEVHDPHSAYLRPATKDNFDIQMGHSLEGIGATLQTRGEYTVVVETVKGGPAHMSGKIKKDDKIIAVGQGEKGKAEDVVDMRIDKVVKKIRGPKGTKVRLITIPADAADQSQTREVIIVRDRVELTSQDAKAEVMEMTDKDGKVHRLGVINIPSFYMDTRAKMRGDANFKSTTRDVRKLLVDLEKQNIDGLVVDLRTNGGGSLDEAIRLTGLFIHEGPVVQIKDYRNKVETEEDPDPAQVYDGPLVVLTSVFSASASEIFASAMQDYGRGVVVGGDSTHGKGTVQNVIDLQSPLMRRADRPFQDNIAGALKITTHKFYRVSGGSTQFKGVLPDIILPSPYDGLKVKEEDLDYALPWDEIEKADYSNYNLVADALPHLRAESAKRVSSSPEFKYLQEDLDRRTQIKDRNTASLNLDQRRKEKQELEDIDKQRDEERKLRKSAFAKVFPKPEAPEKKEGEDGEEAEDEDSPLDPVLEESLFIMIDYLRQHGVTVAVNTPAKKQAL